EVVRLDPIVVTATRTATPLSQIASSVTVITAEDIEAKQQTQVLDVLRSIPGVSVIQSGPLGGQTSVRMRGTDNKHTLILIDGVEFRDASAIGGDANLANLSTDNIEQIEIVRGAQSVLYGSDAIGGVINIITKKGSKEPSGYASAEIGSYSTQRTNVGFSWGNEIVLTSLAASRTESDGFSAANENNGYTEDDSYDNTSFSFNLAVKPVKTFELNLNFRQADSENEFDNSFSGVVSDADNQDNNMERTGKITGKVHLLEDLWQLELGAALSDLERDTLLTSTYGPYNYGYDGKITKFNLLNNIQIGKYQTLVVGLETEKEEYDGYADGETPTQEEATTKAVFIQDQFNAGNVSASVGVRLDDHETFGDKTTWRFAPSYSFGTTGTRIKGSIGTGFKAPSLYQLYHPYFGNLSLEAEESLSYDIGIEQSLFNHSFTFDITYFHNDIKDYIAFDDIGWTGYFQGGDIVTKGVETTLN
ncbi:MAG: TonB-dependent receptor, partial [Desulfocapsa sp.]|nr:TonB-dependent receptor [Desulfocapsa sp.]